MKTPKLSKNNRGFSAVAGVLVVVVLAAIVCLAVYAVHQHTTDNEKVATNQPTSFLAKLAAGHPYPHLASSTNATGSRGYVAYSVPGYSFLVAAKDTDTLAWVGDGALSNSQLDAATLGVKNSLEGAGYSYVTKPPLTLKTTAADGAFYNNPGTGFYTKGDTICLLGSSYSLPVTSATPYPGYLIVDCTTTTALAKVAATVAPLATAYSSAPAANVPYAKPYFQQPTITGSDHPGYKYATVGVGDPSDFYNYYPQLAYFYTNAKGQAWHYALTDLNPPSCSSFSGDALQALSGVCTQ